MPRLLTNGNLALVNGAIVWAIESAPRQALAAERLFFAAGYPITPVNEVTEYLSRIAHEVGGSFVQAESEIAAGNMLLGAASVGVPAFTVTSSPGISLMQEAISYAAGMELGGRGLVYVDVARGGPGLGNIQGAQSDFNQAVLGGGHGDYQNFVLAPASAQEMFDLGRAAFRFSADYRVPGFILSDGYVGQLKEEYEVPSGIRPRPVRIAPDVRTSIFVREGVLEEHNWKLFRRFEALRGDPSLAGLEAVEYRVEDPSGPARILLVNYGIFSRIGRGVVDRARAQGLPVGQVSLKLLNPFPEERLRRLAARYGPFYVMEGSIGQLAGRVAAAAGHWSVVGTCQRPGGTLPGEIEILRDVEALVKRVTAEPFQKTWKEYRPFLERSPETAANRGARYDRIRLEDSSHDAEYAAGMEGKRPEPRKIESMTDKNMYFCTGCDHKYGAETLGAAFDALKDFEINLYSPVGCSIFLYDFFRKDRVSNIQVPHGRGPAAASATKRAKPHSLVITYQGDGDALDIGLGELLHASARGEPITVVVINNGTYGMTGGQLSATTPLEQFSKTTPQGRAAGTHGHPVDLSQMLHRGGVSYYRRTLVGTPELNKSFAHYLSQALLHQMRGTGMSVIEVLATCTEHQRAPKDVIDAFQKDGKKLHQIALAKEYVSKTMPRTFGLEIGWGEDIADADAVIRQARQARERDGAFDAAAQHGRLLEVLDRFGLVLHKDAAVNELPDLRLLLCGEGGQGVQSLADILMKAGRTRYAYNSPWYEPEVTKARTVAALTLSNRPDVNPNPEPGEVDVLVCLTPQMYLQKCHMVRPGGLVLVQQLSETPINGTKSYRIVNVPAARLAAEKANEPRSANIVMLGVLNRLLKIVEDETLETMIRRSIPKAAEKNLLAFRAGREFSPS